MLNNIQFSQTNKISIIIPIYNSQDFLHVCIQSVLNQTYKNFEVLLIDDGSKDNSFAICKEFQTIDKRIKVFQQVNSGVSAARNYGLRNATGDFVCFVDSDDYVSEDYLNSLYCEYKKNNSDLIICGAYGIDLNNKIQKEYCFGKEQKFLIAKNREESLAMFDRFRKEWKYAVELHSVWNKLYKRDLIQNIYFSTEFLDHEDYLFNLKVFEHVKSISVLNKSLYYYRENSSSVSHRKMEPLKERNILLLKVFVLTHQFYANYEINDAYIAELKIKMAHLLYSGLLDCGDLTYKYFAISLLAGDFWILALTASLKVPP